MKKKLPKLPEFEETTPEEVSFTSEVESENEVQEIEQQKTKPEEIVQEQGMVLCKWTNATEEHRIMVRIKEQTVFFTFSAPDFTCYLPENLAEGYHNSEHRIKKV